MTKQIQTNRICLSKYECTHAYTCLHRFTHVYTCLRMYTYVHTHIQRVVYTYIYMYMYTQTRIERHSADGHLYTCTHTCLDPYAFKCTQFDPSIWPSGHACCFVLSAVTGIHSLPESLHPFLMRQLVLNRDGRPSGFGRCQLLGGMLVQCNSTGKGLQGGALNAG